MPKGYISCLQNKKYSVKNLDICLLSVLYQI